MERTRPLAKIAIGVFDLVVFWAVLPSVLLLIGLIVDSRFGLARAPSPWGFPVVVAGLALISWAMVVLRRHGGGLLPGADPPPRVVTTGPFHVVRHPIHLGYNVALVGVALLVGSPGFLVVAGLGVLIEWVLYAPIEERGLVRRFGSAYRFYQDDVGLFPRTPVYRIVQMVFRLGIFPITIEGRENLPRGPYVIVANHACHLDPAFLTCITWRRIRVIATAEFFRSPLYAWFYRRYGAIPLRRYHPDLTASRTMVRLLAAGEIIAISPEGEGSPLGGFQGARPAVATIIARLGVPVVPIGISGNYDAGPRWSGTHRRKPIKLRIGKPIEFDHKDPKQAIDSAILALLDEREQRVHLAGLPREKLSRVLWACPRCYVDDGWNAADLSCSRCGARWLPTDDGFFVDEQGAVSSLFALGAPLFARAGEGDAVSCQAHGFHESSFEGPIGPLEDLGKDWLRITREGITFGSLSIPLRTLRSVTSERADTLQVATGDEMWQFRPVEVSVFRLQKMVEAWVASAHGAPAEARTLTGTGADAAKRST